MRGNRMHDRPSALRPLASGLLSLGGPERTGL